MAIPYPEGAVFFERSVLCNTSSYHYQATNPEHFYSHFMVEYIWNKEADHGSKNANSPRGYSHPRTDYAIVKGSNWGTHYGNWKNLPFSYGPTESQIQRRVQHNLCTNGNRFKNHEKGDAAESWFMTMPMPTKNERWVWIDMLAYIRAIYIPVAWKASEDYPHLSKWVQINFALGSPISVWRGGSHFDSHATHKTWGLGIWAGYTLGLDVTGLTELLSVPPEMRKRGVNSYSAKFVKIVPRTNIKTVSLRDSYSDQYDFNWIKIAGAHHGLSIEYGRAQKGSWFEDFFKNALQFAIGFVPGVGPLLSIAFSLTWTAIGHPEDFLRELSLWVPQVHLIQNYELFKQDVRRSSTELQGLVDEHWFNRSAMSSIGLNETGGQLAGPIVKPTSYFKEAQKILDESGTSPATYEKDMSDGEVVADIPAEDI